MTHPVPTPAAHPKTPGRRVLVIHNPAAGRNRKRRLEEVLARLRDLGCEVTALETRRRGDAEQFAREAAPGDVDVVVAAGGDGTVNEVVNGLVAGPGGVKLAVVPLGTANVLACEIGLDPKDADQIARTIAEGPSRKVHLGTANGRHFVLMAGAGLDAHVVEGVNIALKRRTGKLAYVVESVKQAFGYDFPALKIRADGITYEGRMAVACKGRFYGGPFLAAPGAKLDEPKLHVCILPRTGAAGVVRYGLALPMGKLTQLPEVQVISADSIIIQGPRGAPVQGDGDIVARLPVELRVAPETVELIVPE
ncbi:MAG: diacylglycerol kinase family protein [Pseudomonadota bacterium]